MKGPKYDNTKMYKTDKISDKYEWWCGRITEKKHYPAQTKLVTLN
jgi:hypothetical protein